MKHLIVFLSFFLMFGMGMKAQLNNYKYIIVPKRFETFKNENQYQTSTLIKYLFTKKGYKTVYEGEYPEDLKNDLCSALKVDLEDSSSLFKTRSTLVLKDCEFKEVFRTHEGGSKQKDYKKGYQESIREAFTSFDDLDYVYSPEPKKKKEDTITLNFKNDVKHLDEKSDEPVVEQKATPDEQVFKNKEPVDSNIIKATPNPQKSPEDLLYALKTETGYNLVNSGAEIKFRLLSTAADNIFLLDEKGSNGVVFQKDGKWFLESTTSGKKQLEELNIKF